MEKFRNPLIIILIIIILLPLLFFLLVYGSLLISNTFELSNAHAVEIINRDLNVNLSIDSLSFVYKEYNTNIREEGYIIICDLHNMDINELVSQLRLIQTQRRDIEKIECASIIQQYFYEHEVLYIRYGIDQLISGKYHTASAFAIVLSANGRLLLYVDP